MYPEGNYIRASDDRPFLQIGESKYGKFMLELAVEAHVDLLAGDQDRARLDDEHGAGEPVGGAALRPRHPACRRRRRRSRSSGSTEDSPLLARLRDVWERHLMRAVAELPPITAGDFEAVVSTD